jgi:hypothetical protein
MFRAELPGSGIEVPPERELRDLVKRALRSGRRYIDDHGLKTVREHHDELHERIWKFVADRCRRERQTRVYFSHVRKRLSFTSRNSQHRRNMVRAKVKSEISTKEHLDRISKSAEPEQPLDGQTHTLALPDARCKPDHKSENANGSNGTPPIDASPTQPTDSELAQLHVDWSNLSPLERSDRLKVLIANGHSGRGVAKAIGRSEANIRQYLKFSHLTDEERQAFKEGSMSGKKALEKVQERKVHEWQESVTLNQEQWNKEIDRLVTPARDWFLSMGLPQPCLEKLMSELSGGDGDIRRSEFRAHAPALWEIPIGSDPQEVIRRCRSKGDPATMSGPEYINLLLHVGRPLDPAAYARSQAAARRLRHRRVPASDSIAGGEAPLHSTTRLDRRWEVA